MEGSRSRASGPSGRGIGEAERAPPARRSALGADPGARREQHADCADPGRQAARGLRHVPAPVLRLAPAPAAAMQDPRRPRPPGRSPKPGPGPGDGGVPGRPRPNRRRLNHELLMGGSPGRCCNGKPGCGCRRRRERRLPTAGRNDARVPALEPAGEGALEPGGDKKTTRPISQRKSSSEPDVDEKATAMRRASRSSPAAGPRFAKEPTSSDSVRMPGS